MIKLFITDVDGVLTNGLYYVFEDGGVRSKAFHTRDFHGLWMLNEAGVQVCIISMSNDKIIEQQCERCAKYAHVIRGSRDKAKDIAERYIDSGLYTWNEVAYIGDDIFDIPLLQMSQWAGCPFDAVEEVQRGIMSHLYMNGKNGARLNERGGHGCIREAADMILAMNRKETQCPPEALI